MTMMGGNKETFMTWKDIGQDEGLNQSRIKTFLRCPMQFYFAYVKGIKSKPNIKMTVGTAVHKGVEVNYKQKFKTHEDIALNDMQDAAITEFEAARKRDQLEDSAVDLGRAKDETITCVKVYRAQSAPNFQPLIEPERYFKIQVGNAKRLFFGTIDLIASFKSPMQKFKSVVSDLKTTRRAYDKKRVDVDFQLTSYAYAAVRGIKLKIEKVMFDTVVIKDSMTAKSDLHVSTRDAFALDRFEKTFEQVDRAITLGIFYPTDNEQTCSWCGYKNICHKGREWSIPK